MIRTLDLDALTLASGAHAEPDELTPEALNRHMCIMEAVAFVAGEPWTDAPHCASPVIAAFCRSWNDVEEPYGAAIRERLKSYVPRLVGSRGTPEQEERRAWLATDWLIRVNAPAWLRLAGLTAHAEALAGLPPQTSHEAVRASAAARDAAAGEAAARAARDAAARDAAAGDAAAWDAAAGDAAARAAARAAAACAAVARDAAAGEAARAAAWEAAREPASAAARAAASAAASAAAWEAASAAARAAARDAASAAARAAASAAASAAAWEAASAAATEALRPTMEQLQASAWVLLDDMLAVTEQERAS